MTTHSALQDQPLLQFVANVEEYCILVLGY
jgi:hypothetical protein